MTTEDLGALLKDACDQVMANPALAPKVDKKTGKIVATYCNQGARLVAQAMGCNELDADLTADQMIALMEENASGKWKIATGSDATIHALGGGLAFAAKSSQDLGQAHGHLAAIYPVGMQRSTSWKKDVPMVANVGKENIEEKVSQVFPVAKGEPTYFVWTRDA